ncbi:MAG: phosphate uptake regulator PhoU [Candidatus Hadarchaeales archaeon]
MAERKEESRRIQLTGKSTYIVSLPKWWASEMKLKPGDIINMIVQDDSLLLTVRKSAVEHEREREATLKVLPDENPDKIIRKIVSLYLVGYNTIRIISEKERISNLQSELIKNFVRTKLIGTEVIMDLPTEIVVKVILSYPELSIRDAVRRMTLITKSMIEDSIEALNKKDHELARSVIVRDDDVDRFSMYIIRQLKSAVGDRRIMRDVGIESARDCLGYRLIVKSVERIADHASTISKNVIKLRGAIDHSVVEKLSEMKDLVVRAFEKTIESLFKEDPELSEEVIGMKELVVKSENQIDEMIMKKPARTDAIVISLIVESLRRMYEYSCDIAEVVLNLTLEKQQAV